MVHRLTDPYSYNESSEFDLDSATQLPETFSASDLPKFKPTDDPRFHLKGFRATMAIKGIDPILYPKNFPLSLDLSTAKYRNHLRYLGLESFDKVYHIGVEIENDLLQKSNKNDDKDGVPSSCVNAIETTQQKSKRKRRQYTPLGMSQEQAFDYLTTEGVLEPSGPTPDPMPHRRTKWWNANKHYRYHRGNGQPMPLIITPPDDNQINGMEDDKETSAQDGTMIQLLSRMVEAFESLSRRMILLEQIVQDSLDDNREMTSKNNEENDTPSSSKGVPVHLINDFKKTRRPRREYTPLGMTYTRAFDRQKSKGALLPIGPTPDPPLDRRSRNWDTSKYCKYHQGKGHDTEEC
ncbi:Ribosomal RNA-processing protein 8 [Bienertia sinuspersici]